VWRNRKDAPDKTPTLGSKYLLDDQNRKARREQDRIGGQQELTQFRWVKQLEKSNQQDNGQCNLQAGDY
jgi:hypothetical protein